MGQSSRTHRVGDAASSVASNPYVRRLIEDEELRDSIRDAFESAKDAYARMSNGKGPATTLLDDKKMHRDLSQAAESFKEAADKLRGKRNGGGFTLGKALLIAVIGTALVLILSEDARKAVLDKLFGPEEEFEYTSTSVPEPSQPVSSGTT